jgi:hypothetical protein
MPRTGIEAKPPWQALPRSLRDAVETTLGATVRRAARVWGGYGPTPTFRLRLADGRAAFFKGAGPEDSEFVKDALRREERVYRELADVINPWAPILYGAIHDDPWHVLLLEDLGPKSVPPWPRGMARQITQACAEFHRSTADVALPSWVPPVNEYLSGFAVTWDRLAADDRLPNVANLAGERAAEARAWLDAAWPTLVRAGRGLLDPEPPHVFIHGDTRSDNLR